MPLVSLSCCRFLLFRVQPEKPEEAASARERLAGMAGTSSAFYDLDSDGFGLRSREGVKAVAATDMKEVEKALKEKARWGAALIYITLFVWLGLVCWRGVMLSGGVLRCAWTRKGVKRPTTRFLLEFAKKKDKDFSRNLLNRDVV